MFDAVHVGAEGLIHGREELNQPRAVEDQADASLEAVQAGAVQPAERQAHVSRPDRKLGVERCLAVLRDKPLHNRSQRGRIQGLGLEAVGGAQVALRPQQDMEVLETRITFQQHSQNNFAQEAVRSGQ